MKSLRNLPMQTRRDAWVEVNLDAIEHNVRAIRRHVPPGIDLMAIVKADAYGHGAVMILPTLEASGVSMAGVAAIDEAIHIREAGIKLPILVIGTVPDWAVQTAANYDIQLTVFDTHHLDSLKKAFPLTRKPVKVHIKVDTGMHRIGIAVDQALDFIRHCQVQDYIQVEGLFSHLADSHDPVLTQAQLARWESLLAQVDPLPRYVHIGNSGLAANGGNLERHGNLLRLGYAFYGYEPLNGSSLQPAMGLKARIMHIQEIPPGTGISYNHTWHSPPDRTSRIATLPLGYADGVPRCLSNRIEGLMGGRRFPQVGAITMDQMMFDITGAPEAAIGNTMTLIGRDGDQAIWLDDWAAKAGTIPYELMCGLRVRLPKTYTR